MTSPDVGLPKWVWGMVKLHWQPCEFLTALYVQMLNLISLLFDQYSSLEAHRQAILRYRQCAVLAR